MNDNDVYINTKCDVYIGKDVKCDVRIGKDVRCKCGRVVSDSFIDIIQQATHKKFECLCGEKISVDMI